MTFLLGGPRLQMSYGVLDDTTIVMTMGDAATLQRLADEGSEVAQTLLTRTISDTE